LRARVPNGIRGLGPSVMFEQYGEDAAWDNPGAQARSDWDQIPDGTAALP